MIEFLAPFIPSWVKWLWSKRRIVAAAVSVGALAFFVWLAGERGRERDDALASVKTYKEALSAERDWNTAVYSAIERKVDDDRNRAEFEVESARTIAADRVNGDGPLSPVLHRGLDVLQRRQADHSKHNSR